MKTWLKGGFYGLVVGIIVFIFIVGSNPSMGGNPAEKQQQDLIAFIIIIVISIIIGVIVGTLIKGKEKKKIR